MDERRVMFVSFAAAGLVLATAFVAALVIGLAIGAVMPRWALGYLQGIVFAIVAFTLGLLLRKFARQTLLPRIAGPRPVDRDLLPLLQPHRSTIAKIWFLVICLGVLILSIPAELMAAQATIVMIGIVLPMMREKILIELYLLKTEDY